MTDAAHVDPRRGRALVVEVMGDLVDGGQPVLVQPAGAVVDDVDLGGIAVLDEERPRG
jgi:hypothetical protein